MDSMPLRSLLLAAALSVAFSPRVALADVFAASILTDAADPTPADGICDVDPVAEGEQCTLRAAIQTANAVKGLVPIVLGGDVQTRHTLRRVIHHRQLFVEGQARKQILNSFTNGKIAI